MTATTQINYSWLKQLPSSLLQSNDIPLIGFSPPFPWEQCAAKLSELLEIKGVALTPASAPELRTKDGLLAGLGGHPLSFSLSVAPEGGIATLAMSQENVALLMSILLNRPATAIQDIDADFLEGFYRFLALEVAYAIPQLEFDKKLALNLVDSNLLPQEDALCLDLSISLSNHTMAGRLIFSQNLMRQWRERYAERTLDLPVADKLDFTIHLEMGHISFQSKEWAKVKPGDFIPLNRSTFHPDGEKNLTLTLHGLPLFGGKIENNSLVLFEYTHHEEEEDSMSENDSGEEFHEEEDSTLDHENEEFEEFEESDSEDENNHDTDMEFTEETEVEQEETGLEGQEEEFEEEFSEREEEQAISSAPSETGKKRREESQTSNKPDSTTPSEPVEEEIVSLGQVPFSLVIEAGRIRMPLQKLMALQPGNILELNVHPETGVDLVVNGKRIGKGELLLLGEALGVRVLDLG